MREGGGVERSGRLAEGRQAQVELGAAGLVDPVEAQGVAAAGERDAAALLDRAVQSVVVDTSWPSIQSTLPSSLASAKT